MPNRLIALSLDFATEANTQQLPGAKNANTADAGFGIWLGSLMSAVMMISGVLVLFYLLWGGIEWITSGGDKGKTEAARNKITAAVIGLIVLASSTAIIMVLQQFLGACFLKIGTVSC